MLFSAPPPPKHARSGFTLVELSIVLVIIGLLIGGVLVGANMVKASELQSIGTDVNRFRTAANMFKMRYNATPGDMKNATDFWGTASDGCPDGVADGTCNGDGNGIITDGTGNEIHRFWQHLALSGLIAGSFTGVNAPGGSTVVHVVIGLNGPASRVVGVGYSATNMRYDGGKPYLFSGDYSHTIMIGKQTYWQTHDPFMTPTEAYALDSKFDDGKPGLGLYVTRTKIAAADGGYPGCTDGTTTDGATAKYLIDDKTIACALHIINAF